MREHVFQADEQGIFALLCCKFRLREKPYLRQRNSVRFTWAISLRIIAWSIGVFRNFPSIKDTAFRVARDRVNSVETESVTSELMFNLLTP